MQYRGNLSEPNSKSVDVTIELQPNTVLIRTLNGSATIWELIRIDRMRSKEEGIVLLQYNSTPSQLLRVSDVSFEYSLKMMYPDYGFSKIPKHSSNSGKWALVLVGILLVVISVALVAYLYLFPFITDRVALHIPAKYEQQIGKEIAASMLEGEKKNVAAGKTLNAFFKELHFNQHDSVRLVVVESEQVNAFALPGGTIVAFDEIIRKTKTAEELAALLAHEYSHVHYRHSLRSMVKGLSSWLVIAVLTGGNSELIGALAQNADQLRQLKYSRDFEREADANAMRLLKQQELNPQGMLDLMKTLQEQEEEMGGSLMQHDFLSTHPVTKERIETATAAISKKDFRVNQHPLLDSLYLQLQTEVKAAAHF